MSHVAASLLSNQVPVIVPPFERTSALPEASKTRPSAPSPVQHNPVVSPASTNEASKRPHRDTSDPGFWMWRVLTAAIKPDVIRAGTFSEDGAAAVAVGPNGVARWAGSQWIGVATSFDTARLRGVASLGRGEALLFGTGGLLVRLTATGACEILPVPDPEATLCGGHVDPRGTLMVVGDRADRSQRGTRVGFVVEYQGHRIAQANDAANTTRLRAVTRLASGAYVAVGDGGALVRIDRNGIAFRGSLCHGDLLATSALPDGGAFAVGTGGHAFSLTPALDWHLEAVQTTADLLAVCATSDGTGWAGAQKARIVRRTGDSWVRMSGELGIASGVCALWAGPRIVRGLCSDGAVIEGRLP